MADVLAKVPPKTSLHITQGGKTGQTSTPAAATTLEESESRRMRRRSPPQVESRAAWEHPVQGALNKGKIDIAATIGCCTSLNLQD